MFYIRLQQLCQYSIFDCSNCVNVLYSIAATVSNINQRELRYNKNASRSNEIKPWRSNSNYEYRGGGGVGGWDVPAATLSTIQLLWVNSIST